MNSPVSQVRTTSRRSGMRLNLSDHRSGTQMDAIVQYLKSNAEWIFSGIGVSALAVLAYLLRMAFKRQTSQKQTVAGGSSAIQAGRDVKINSSGKGD